MVAQRWLARPFVRACVLSATAVAIACGRTSASRPPPPDPTPSPVAEPRQHEYRPVQIEMKNVRLHAADGVILEVSSLRGEMVPRNVRQVPAFDDPNTYVLHVFSAQLAMDMASLTHLMNDFLFAYDGAPLEDIRMEIDDGMLKQIAKLRKGLKIPVSVKAKVSATPDGRLRLATEKVKALGVPATKLMDLFGLELDDVVNLKARRGVEIDDNDIVLSPGLVLPPPEIRGRIVSATIVGDKLVQTLSSNTSVKAMPRPPDAASPNYIFFSGETLRFGRLTMTPAALQLIDNDKADWFDFYPAKYEVQLVAGYSKNTPSGALKTYMPDRNDLLRR